MSRAESIPAHRYYLALAAVFAAALLVRLAAAGFAPAGVMEADQLLIGRMLRADAEFLAVLAEFRHGPLWPWIVKRTVGLFGAGEWQLRLPSVVLSSMTAVGLPLALGPNFGRAERLWLAVWLACAPWFFEYSISARPYALHFAATAGALVCVARLAEEGRGWLFGATVACAVTATLNHLMAAVPLAAGGIALLAHYRAAPYGKRAIAAFALAALLSVPWALALQSGFKPVPDLNAAAGLQWLWAYLRRSSGALLPFGLLAALPLVFRAARRAHLSARELEVELSRPFEHAFPAAARVRLTRLAWWVLLLSPAIIMLVSQTPIKPTRIEYLLPCLFAALLLVTHGLRHWRREFRYAVAAPLLLAALITTTVDTLRTTRHKGREPYNVNAALGALRRLPADAREIWIYPDWAETLFDFYAEAGRIPRLRYLPLRTRELTRLGGAPYCVLLMGFYDIHREPEDDPAVQSLLARGLLTPLPDMPRRTRLLCSSPAAGETR